jgi:tetratricopeptide (TPR) repeat protein
MEANEFYKDAVKCYESARNMDPSSPEVEERLAQAHWLNGDTKLAVKEFEELAYKRHYTRALLGLGKALDDLGEYQRAINVYEEFLKAGFLRDHWFDFWNREGRGDPRSLAIAHMNIAATYAKLRKHEDALAELQKALDTLPGDALVLVRRGMVLADAGDLDAGITELQSVVGENESADPVPFASFLLGVLFERKGELEKATEHFRTATEQRPDWGEAHNSLAKSLTRQGRLYEARSEFGKKAKLSSNLVDRKYFDVLASQWLGNMLRDLCNYAEAASEYQRAIDLKPDYRIAYNELGRVFERQGQLARAIEEYRKAVAAEPNELDTKEWFVITDIRLGEALLREGNDREAIFRFSKAIERDEKNVEAHYGLALALYKQGREQEAAAQCEAVNKVLPGTCPRQPPPWERANTSCSKRNSAL